MQLPRSLPSIDMHCHSTESDGRQSPEQVYQEARNKNIMIFAITDHDRITHIDRDAGLADNIYLLRGAEVSTFYQDPRSDFSRSIHVPIYAHSFSQEVEDLLSNVRRGKQKKVELQCEKLASNGCQIELPDKSIVPFSFEAMQQCFPNTQKDGFNNAHLVELVRRHRDNFRKLEEIAPGINERNLLREGMKREGRYSKQISLPKDLPRYEPTIGELKEAIGSERALISLAHPNYTFRSIDEYRSQIFQLLSQGITAIEKNSTATQDWIDTIDASRKDAQKDFPTTLLTYGSDCHDLFPEKPDRRHSLLGDINPSVSRKEQLGSMLDILAFFHDEPQFL